MDWLALVYQIFELCIIPLLAILTKFLIDFIKVKKDEIIQVNNNELSKKYIEMISDTITTCVIATNQTYVNSLKEQGAFDEAAQKAAFTQTLNAVVGILNEDAKKYIVEVYGDLTIYLTQKIEAEVYQNREETALA